MILEMRARLFAEAVLNTKLKAVIALAEILDAEPGRRTGVTHATKLRAAREVFRLSWMIR